MSHWQFRPLNPNENSGISTVDDNFANEERSSVEILVRETLQNPLDARHTEDLVEVRYSLVSIRRSNSRFLDELFSPICKQHFTAGKLLGSEELPDVIEFLVVEDFGTTGLEGCYSDSSVDGRSENWNAFWFREGEGAKPTRSNGGAGQGKITLYAASGVRSVIALTNRSSDNKKLLFGCCRFKQNYKIGTGNLRWAKEARWGNEPSPEKLATPIDDVAFIEAMEKELLLQRGSRPGTSFLVPMPTDITLADLRKAVVNEFFFPIRRGRLKVVIGDEVLDSNSIASAAKGLGDAARYPSDYRKFLENSIISHVESTVTANAKMSWSQNSKLSDDAFDEIELARLKESFEKTQIVSVNFPVKVRKKGVSLTESKFRVIVQQYADGEQSHELFVRQDLGIDGEKRLKGSRRILPVLALTFIDDLELSAFLMAAEEPTHRTWNSKRPKVVSQYDKTTELLSAVRNAALRLVELLTPVGKRDNTALALYFSDPESPKDGKRGERGDSPVDKNPDKKIFPTIPPAKKKAIEFQSRKNGFVIKTVADEITNKLPMYCEIRTAYATTYGDAFKQWDAAEFWLNDEKEFPIESVGISSIKRDGNTLQFYIDSEDAMLAIAGFDQNRKVEVQIIYSEKNDAEDFENN